MSKRILILNWPNSERDYHITASVGAYLEKKYGYIVQYKSVFDGWYRAFFNKPDAMFIANTTGSWENFRANRLFSKNGIRCFESISEGIIVAELAAVSPWAWNHDGHLYSEKMFLWNDSSKTFFHKYRIHDQEKYIVTGYSGIDRYKILPKITKNEFFKAEKLKEYKHVIGIAGWGFDILFQKSSESLYSQEYLLTNKSNFLHYKNGIETLIKDNPDILFIARYHPGMDRIDDSEFKDLIYLPNVYISNPRTSSYSLDNILSICDIWLGYESTTWMEAWLLNKPTIAFNKDFNFDRPDIYKGTFTASSTEEVQNYITVTLNNLKTFSLSHKATEILSSYFGHTDGKNHQRIGNEIEHTLNLSINSNSSIYVDFHYIVKSIIRSLLFLCKLGKLQKAPRLKKGVIEDLHKEYKHYLQTNLP